MTDIAGINADYAGSQKSNEERFFKTETFAYIGHKEHNVFEKVQWGKFHQE